MVPTRKHIRSLSRATDAVSANYVDLGILLLDFIRIAERLNSSFGIDFTQIFNKAPMDDA